MPIRYTLRQLEYLVAVGRAGSIAAAAQQVNVSSPSISAGISHLEHELGVQLFIRHHAHGLTPTPAGQELIEHAQAVLRQAAALRDLAGELSGRIGGPLAVGCLSSFAQMVLPGLRRSFVDQYPDVRISQIEADQAELFSLLRQAKLDVVLTYDLNLPADLTFVPLLDLPPLVAMAADHPLAGRAQVSAAELAPLPMVLLDLPLSSDYFLSFFNRQGLRPNITERTRDIAVARSLVANGFGYSIFNMRPFDDRAPDGQPLRFVRLAGKPRPMKMGMLMNTSVSRSELQRAFLNAARLWITRHGARLSAGD